MIVDLPWVGADSRLSPGARSERRASVVPFSEEVTLLSEAYPRLEEELTLFLPFQRS